MKTRLFLLFLLCVFWSTAGHAFSSRFDRIAGDFQIDAGEWSSRSCDGCHKGQERASAPPRHLRLTAPEIGAGDTSVVVTVRDRETSTNGNNFTWNYRVNGSTEIVGDDTESKRIVVGTGQSPEIDYCIIDRIDDANNFMYYNCETLTVMRKQNEAPQVSVSPGGTIDIPVQGTATVTVTGNDPDGSEQDLRYQETHTTRVASVSIDAASDGRSATYTIRAGVNPGTGSVTATVRDNRGASGSQSTNAVINVRVVSDNTPPRMSDVANQSVVEGTSKSITVDVVDEDPGSVSYSVTNNSSESVASVTSAGDGVFNITGKVPGTTTVTIAATDNQGESDSESFMVTVTEQAATNGPPVIASLSPVSLDVTTFRTLTVNVSDENPSQLSYRVSANSDTTVASAAFTSGASLSIVALKAGQTTIQVTVTDDEDQTDTESFVVTVNEDSNPGPENQAPVIDALSPVSISTSQSQTFSVSVTDEDRESLVLTVSSNSRPDVASVSTSGFLELSAQGLSAGQTSVQITVVDNGGKSASSSFTVTVSEENSAPRIVSIAPSDQLTIDANSSTSVTLTVEDESASSQLVFSAQSQDEGIATVSVQSDGAFTVTGQSAGSTRVDLSVRDEQGAQSTQAVEVTVIQQNRAPEAVDDQFVFTFDSSDTLLYVLNNDSDPESSALSIRLDTVNTQLGGTVDVVTAVNAIVYTPPENFTTQDTFSYQVADPDGALSNTATVTIRPSDIDGDTFFDNNDNCRFLKNPGQEDLDSDGIGDLCDADPDGDGKLGEIGFPFASGQSLVERICLDCHRVGLVDSPEFGNDVAWAARVEEAGGVEVLLESVTLGKGEMPAWGREYTARELTQAVQYITGLEDIAVEPGFIDRDLDGINDLTDNCINHPNTNQADSDSNGVGDACEPDANGDGVLDYSLSFTIFQETAAGRIAGGIVQADKGQVTVLAGTRADITGLTFDWSDNSAEVLQLLGSEVSGEAVRFIPTAADIGVYDFVVSVQGPGLVGSTRARLVITEDAGIDLSDGDYDGYPAALDSDNANANRVLVSPETPVTSDVFYSDQSITLGELTSNSAVANRYSRVSPVLSENEFLDAVNGLGDAAAAVTDPVIQSSIGVINFELRDLDTDSADIRLNVMSGIPVNPEFKVYSLSGGFWQRFTNATSNSLSSAPSDTSECPASDSSNYSAGLTAGHTCVRFRLTDAGPNDADGLRDGVISIIGAIGSQRVDNDDPESPEIDLTPSRSGGGGMGWFILMMLATMSLVRAGSRPVRRL